MEGGRGTLLEKGFPFPPPNLPLSPPKTFINGAGDVWGGPTGFPQRGSPGAAVFCYAAERLPQKVIAVPSSSISAMNLFLCFFGKIHCGAFAFGYVTGIG